MEQTFTRYNAKRTSKQCGKCWKFKRLSKFYRRLDTKNSLTTWCKKCLNKAREQRAVIYRNVRKREYADIQRASRLKKEYSITAEQYRQLLVIQKFKCKICDTSVKDLNKRLSIDHSHSTGKIRGLLCMSCNLGLGQFKDSKLLLQKATHYLGENNEWNTQLLKIVTG